MQGSKPGSISTSSHREAPHSRPRPPARSSAGPSSASAVRSAWRARSRTASSSTWPSRSIPASRCCSWTRASTSPRPWPTSRTCGARYDLNLRVLTPGPEADALPCGSERCCELRKVVPLDRALEGRAGVDDRTQAGATPPPGPRRRSCRGTTARGLVKINPIATWTDDDVDQLRGRPRSPRPPADVRRGYLSIGCAPTTRPGGAGRGPPGRSLGRHGQDRVRLARLTWPVDRDNPLGVEFRGNERSMHFVQPYRTHRGAEPGRALEARPPPPRSRRRRHRRATPRRVPAPSPRCPASRSGSSGSASTRSARAATPS